MEKSVEIIQKNQDKILNTWMDLQKKSISSRLDLIKEEELLEESKNFIQILTEALSEEDSSDLNTGKWKDVNQFLKKISKTRAQKGFSSSETAAFIFSIKQPIFKFLWEKTKDKKVLEKEVWDISLLLDKLGMITSEAFQKSKEDIISRQREDILELSTPVIKLWEDILAVPLIGTLDSARFQTIMESLLKKINETGSTIAIIDITGVAVMDTMVAQHLLKTISAARLMGTECIISGISPQIAQTIVYLGIDLTEIETRTTLADAIKYAFIKTGTTVSTE